MSAFPVWTIVDLCVRSFSVFVNRGVMWKNWTYLWDPETEIYCKNRQNRNPSKADKVTAHSVRNVPVSNICINYYILSKFK